MTKTKTPATWIIIAVNIVVYLVLLMVSQAWSGNIPRDLQALAGAKRAVYINDWELWRFFAPLFIHITYSHIVGTVVSIAVVGRYLEKNFGTKTFLMVYFIGGLAGNLTSYIWVPNMLDAGASTSLMAMFGAMFGYLLLIRSKNLPYLKWLLVTLGFYLFYLYADTKSHFVATPEHTVSLIAGFLLINMCVDQRFTKIGWTYLLSLVVITFILIIKANLG